MFSILSRRLYPEKIGFWVWVLDWVLYPNPNQKPKKFYTQTTNPNQNPKIFIPKPKPKTKKYLYPNPKPKSKKFLGTNV